MKMPELPQLGIPTPAMDLYLAALKLGTSSVQELAKQAGLKRPTAYTYIESLLQEGLFEQITIGKRTFYRAADPQILIERTKTEQKKAVVAQEWLQSLMRSTGKPKVSLVEGKEALSLLYDDVAQAKSTIRFWSDLISLQQLFAKDMERVNQALKTSGVEAREIIPGEMKAKRIAQLNRDFVGNHYQYRLSSQYPPENDCIILEDAVYFIRLQGHNLYAIKLGDASFAKMMQNLFDLAWQSAQKVT